MEAKPKEIQVMKARARKLLDELAGCMFIWGNRGHDFKGIVSPHWSRRDAPLGEVIVSNFKKGGAKTEVAWLTAMHTMGHAVDICRSILVSLANDEPIIESDLDALTSIYGIKNSVLRFTTVNPEAGSFFEMPYRRVDRSTGGISPQAAFAEALLEYMNISALYGRVHWICQRQGCGTLMTGGRGGKKFCSPACRQAHWTNEPQRIALAARKRKVRAYAKKIASRRGATNAKSKGR